MAEKSLEGMVLPARRRRLEKALEARTASLAVALEHLHKSHNVSAILRTCDAFGVQHVHLIPRKGEEGITRSVTRGCDKWMTLTWHRSAAACYRALRREGYRVLAASLGEGAEPLEETDFSGRVVLVFGNELAGASAEAREAADGLFVIPMIGFTRSLNVSVAAGIAIRHARLVKEREGRVGDLHPEERERLWKEWLRRSVRRSAEILRHLRREP